MRVVFIGTGEIGLPTLRFLQQATGHELVGVITQPDKVLASRRCQPDFRGGRAPAFPA